MPSKATAPSLEKTKSKPAALLSYEQRTLTLPAPAPALRTVCLALALQNKNLYNTTHFAVNNVLTAYEPVEQVDGSGGAKTYRLKPKLHDNQTLALARFNRANTNRRAKHEALLAAGGEPAEKARLVLIPALGAEVDSVYRAALDLTVLDNVLREWPGAGGTPVYGRLPARWRSRRRRSIGHWPARPTARSGLVRRFGAQGEPSVIAERQNTFRSLLKAAFTSACTSWGRTASRTPPRTCRSTWRGPDSSTAPEAPQGRASSCSTPSGCRSSTQICDRDFFRMLVGRMTRFATGRRTSFQSKELVNHPSPKGNGLVHQAPG